jgi:G:T-mismatch repair DNA endonuclease (very short patch repair protein)
VRVGLKKSKPIVCEIARQTETLQKAGWTVIRIWEYDLVEKRISTAIDQ